MIVKIIFTSFFLVFIVGCTNNLHLYQYNNYPCENRIIQLDNDMVLLVRGTSAMNESLYYLTRNALQDYSEYKEYPYQTAFIEKKIYQKGSKFKVIGFYWPVDSSILAPNNVQYYLLKSLEDKKIAWLSSSQFNYNECQPYHYTYETRFEPKEVFKVTRGSHDEKEVDLSKLKKKAYK